MARKKSVFLWVDLDKILQERYDTSRRFSWEARIQ